MAKKPKGKSKTRPRRQQRAAARKGAARRATSGTGGGSRLKAKARQSTKPKTRRVRATSKTKARRQTQTSRVPPKVARLDRDRRMLSDIIPTPPSSLNMNRHGSAVRTGRAEMAEALANHASMTPAITGGDVDADLETAYFSGDEAPGGDNPTPDQDVVEDIGRALGVEYQDAEELRGGDKVAARDKHRWELDPASSEDYRDRKK